MWILCTVELYTDCARLYKLLEIFIKKAIKNCFYSVWKKNKRNKKIKNNFFLYSNCQIMFILLLIRIKIISL